MSTVQVTKTCSKATFEALDATAKFVTAVKKALADGWQPLGDTSAIVMEAIKDFGSMVQNVGDIQAEAAAGGPEFQNALGIGGAEILGAFRS